MSLTEEKKRNIRELKSQGKTYKEIAKELKVNFTQISETLKGEQDPLETEYKTLHPFLVQLMRSSGEKTIKDSVIASVEIHTSLNRVSLDRGFKTTEQYVKFTDGRDLLQQEEILRLKEALDTWMWSTDEELAALIGINSQVMRRLNRAKLRDSRRRLWDFINYIIPAYFRLLKKAGLVDEAVQ